MRVRAQARGERFDGSASAVEPRSAAQEREHGQDAPVVGVRRR
jgi:hypothetical protein